MSTDGEGGQRPQGEEERGTEFPGDHGGCEQETLRIGGCS
jgi:hypothetical protein